MSYQIGPFTFDLMTGEVKRYQPAVETFTRSGVDGSEDRLLGYRGEPFFVDTIARAVSLEAGEEGLVLYSELVRFGQQQFRKDGLLWDNVGIGYRVKVLAPLEGSVRFTSAMTVAGVAYTNVYIVRARWLLRMEPNIATDELLGNALGAAAVLGNPALGIA